jgi:hypothetical protein
MPFFSSVVMLPCTLILTENLNGLNVHYHPLASPLDTSVKKALKASATVRQTMLRNIYIIYIMYLC